MLKVKTIILTLLIAILILNCENVKESENKLDKSLIESAVSEWTAMWNSYDLDQVDRLFVKNSNLTYFSSEKEGVIRGIEAVREHHVGFGFVSGGKEQTNKLWFEDVSVDLLETSAVVTGIWFFQKPGEEGAKPQRGPVTIVYVKDADEVRIVHMNFGNYLETK